MTKLFTICIKNIYLKSLKNPNQYKWKKITPRYIIDKQLKTKIKEKMLKVAKGKKRDTLHTGSKNIMMICEKDTEKTWN